MKIIKFEEFLKQQGSDPINLVSNGFFLNSDIQTLFDKDRSSFVSKVEKLISYFPFVVRHPQFIIDFILPQIISSIDTSSNTNSDVKESETVKKCEIKAGIANSFKPSRMLEIGTSYGVAAASFKKAMPYCEVYTVCPRLTAGYNNPLEESNIGYFYREKGLKVIQLWSDSTKLDFSKLPVFDVVYIDGNHSFEYVYKDLSNFANLTRKCIILDDYVSKKIANKYNMVYGPWNEGVVNAVNKFLIENPDMFREKYLIEGTPYCLLIK
ncbi:MAG: class I SAM-dependent methyltransferase [bacterium]|nr:class I SAM-dependent methyltransferase [bacterium]